MASSATTRLASKRRRSRHLRRLQINIGLARLTLFRNLIFTGEMICLEYIVGQRDLRVDITKQTREPSGRLLELYICLNLTTLMIFDPNLNACRSLPRKLWNFDRHITLAYAFPCKYTTRWALELRAQAFLSAHRGARIQAQCDHEGGVLRLLVGCQLYAFAMVLQQFLPQPEDARYEALHISLGSPLLQRKVAGGTGNGEINNQVIINEDFLSSMD